MGSQEKQASKFFAAAENGNKMFSTSQKTAQVSVQRGNVAPAFARSIRVTQPRVAGMRSTRIYTQERTELTGVVFQPFSEVQSDLSLVDKTDNKVQTFVRVNFTDTCEAAINEQINIEYIISYVYHAMFAYFDRDNVGLPGIAKFFKENSEEERQHAELLMKYQNMRGGRVKLLTMGSPETEFYHEEKGDALHAFEMALALEKLNFKKLLELHKIAEESNDVQLCDFLEGQLLQEQVEAVKQGGVYVSQLRRIGKGHGVFHFDRTLDNGHETA